MRLLAFIGVIAIIVAIAAAVFFLGGFYNISATVEDPGIVNWVLIRTRMASINQHATDQAPSNLGDLSMVQAGARAFLQRGCPACHGAPGVEWQKFSEGLRPDPPDLKDIVNDLEPRQLFWVVKNGIRMTGMPSFGAIGVDDKEIWSIAAFLKKLPTVSDTDFKSWTAGPAPSGNP